MNLSEASKMRFNGVDVKMIKLNGDIVYRKKEEEPLLIAQYTASESGVVPKFNTDFTGYNVSETVVDGIYSVTIRTNTADNAPTSILFNGMNNLLTVDYLKIDNVTNMTNMFSSCSSLTSLDVSDWDTSNVINMTAMFSSCSSLTSLDASGWNTSNVTSMMYMFNSCKALTSLDVSGWDTYNVTSMTSMFNNCSSLTSLDSMMNISTDLSLPSSLNEESILDIVDNLASVSSRKTLKISNTQLRWVPEDKIIEANNKGWTISA